MSTQLSPFTCYSSSKVAQYTDVDNHLKPDKNIQIAKKLSDISCELQKQFSLLPLTAWWLLHKPGQSCSDITNTTINLSGFTNLERAYQIALTRSQSSPFSSSPCLLLQQQITRTLENRPLLGTDMSNLHGLLFQNTAFGHFSATAPLSQNLIVTENLKSLLQKYDTQMLSFLFPKSIITHDYLQNLTQTYQNWLQVRDTFAMQNYGLVRLLQRQYQNETLTDDDLFQEGVTGLLKAIDRFDYHLGFKFSTYAVYWIRQAISRALTSQERIVRLPFAQMSRLNKLRQAREQLLLQTGKEPNNAQLAKYLQISKAEVDDLQSISGSCLSLEQGNEENDDCNLLNLLETKHYISPFKQHANQQLYELFINALPLLNAREKNIICWRFGLNCNQELTLDEIGKQLNLTRERVRQIQAGALEKINQHYGEQLQDFDLYD